MYQAIAKLELDLYLHVLWDSFQMKGDFIKPLNGPI